jgi:DNA-binding winged helix-turn-helix (wHTH) protein
MYLINKNIEFHPERYQLINREKGGQSISLPVSASRCLLALLANKRVVTHQELFEFVWGEHHREVTPNNLYQNISILRKTLKIVDQNTSDWINTVPKKGFTFNVNIPLEEITGHDSQTQPPPEKLIMTQEQSVKRRRLHDIPLNNKEKLIFLGFVVLTGLAMFLINGLPPSREVSASFIFYQKIGACLVYINNDMREKNVHEKILLQSNLDCQKLPYAYITAYSIVHAATIIECEKPINSARQHCGSLLLREVNAS